MNKVYIVTSKSDEYDEYHIDAVFATREDAETFIQNEGLYTWKNNRKIEEYNVEGKQEKVDTTTIYYTHNYG